jgi:hypothetical protein
MTTGEGQTKYPDVTDCIVIRGALIGVASRNAQRIFVCTASWRRRA